MSEYTKQEAIKHWCPFSRYEDEVGAVSNRWHGSPGPMLNPAPCRCIASECMAWRWGPVVFNAREFPETKMDLWEMKEEPPRPAHVPAHWQWRPGSVESERAACWIEPPEDAAARRKGYCGLAGKAQP